MSTKSTQNELASLFEQRNFQAILDRAQRDEITPATNPHAANVVAAALFQVGRYPECLLWCEGLSPSLENDVGTLHVWSGSTTLRENQRESVSEMP